MVLVFSCLEKKMISTVCLYLKNCYFVLENIT